MIPRLSWRSRLRLAWAVWTGRVYVDNAKYGGGLWGQTIRLRTVEDIVILRDEDR